MWFFGLIVVLLIGAVAVVASGRWGAMAPAYDDRPDLTVPARQALTAEDLQAARFGVGLRGYRMDEVDTLLERVAREVAERDRRIADLERAVSPIIHGPEGAGFTSRSEYQPQDFEDTGYTQPILVGGNFPQGQEEPVLPEPHQQPPTPPAQPEAQVGGQPEADPHREQLAEPPAVAGTEPPPPATAHVQPGGPDVLGEPHAVPPPAAAGVQAEDWFEEEKPSPLDGQPQPPVPLPPLLQELVHTHEENEPEPTPWFQAKEPPPDHTATTNPAPEPQHPATETPASADNPGNADNPDNPDDGDEQPRGRHSAAPDVSSVQRPT